MLEQIRDTRERICPQITAYVCFLKVSLEDVEASWPILNEHSLESLQCVPEVFSEVFSFIFLDLSFGLL